MAVRGIPGVKKRQVGNKSVDELEKLLRERLQSTSTAPRSGEIDIRKVPGSNERRTGVPADIKSRSARGTLPPNSSTVPKTAPSTPGTYTARGKTYVNNPNDRANIFLKNHPVLAGLKGPQAKNKFLKAHPKIANRASQVTTVKGPALSGDNSYRAAILRRLKKVK
jgi:hypothetical protein